VAKSKDGWLSRGMGCLVETRLAKSRDGWLSRGMGGEVL
jgi:hypothetical protein